jgi:integrase
LLATCDESRDKARVLLLLDTGMKLGEVEVFQLGDIKWAENRIKIPKRRAEYAALSEPTWAALKAWVEQRPSASHKTVFVSLKGVPEPLSSRGIDHILRTLGEKSGVGTLSARRLRNTFLQHTDVSSENKGNGPAEPEVNTVKRRFSCPKQCKWVLGFLGFSFILGLLFYLLSREED